MQVKGKSRRVDLVAAAAVAAVALAVSAAPAAATITIGQIATAPFGNCAGNADMSQKTVSSGAAYTSPVSGTVKSWSTNAGDSAGAQWSFKVFHPLGGDQFSVSAVDGPHALIAAHLLSKFDVNIPIKQGDRIGFHILTAGTDCIQTGLATDVRYFLLSTDLALGASGTLSSATNARVNISAVVDPTNTFKRNKPSLNKKKGTATVKVDLPNPGFISLGGSGVKPILLKKVSAAGAFKLKVAASGKKKRTLNDKGKVKVKPTITYTPTGGSATQQKVSLKLKKKLK